MQNSPKKSSPDSKKQAKPLAYLWAFFHPVSRSDLQKSFEEADKVAKEVTQTLAESKRLRAMTDRALAMK